MFETSAARHIFFNDEILPTCSTVAFTVREKTGFYFFFIFII